MSHPVLLTSLEKAEFVFISGDGYKTIREATRIFNGRHPEKQLNHY